MDSQIDSVVLSDETLDRVTGGAFLDGIGRNLKSSIMNLVGRPVQGLKGTKVASPLPSDLGPGAHKARQGGA